MIRSSHRRLSAVLLRLCGARLDVPAGETVSALDVTQQELAQLSNMSRSMVGRILDDMEQAGQIERRYGQISFVGRDVLKQQLMEEVL